MNLTKTRLRLLNEALSEYRIDDRTGGLAWIYPKMHNIKDIVNDLLGRCWAIHIENSGSVCLYKGAENQIQLLDKLKALGYNNFILC